jgi:type I restriction enzyme S subunit
MGLKTFIIDFAEIGRMNSLFLTTRIKEYNQKYSSNYLPLSYFLDNKNKFTLGQIKREDYQTDGEFPVVDQSQEFIAGYSDEDNLVYSGNLPVIVFGDHTRIFKYVDFKFIQGADGIKVIKPNEEIVTPKFFFYLMSKISVPSRGYNRHFSILKKQKYPLIPKPKQDQIVAQIEPIEEKIKELKDQITPPQEVINKVFAREFGFDLEKFEESKKVKFFEVDFSIMGKTSDLKSNVSTSLNNKIDFQMPNVKYFKIKNITKNIFAGGDMPKDFSDEKDEVYKYPIYSNGKENIGFIAYCKKARVEEKATTISARGTIGFAVARNESYFPIVRLISVIPNEKFVLNEYLTNVINFQNIEKSGNTIAQLTTPMVESIKIPLPDLKKQQKIVDEIKAELDKQEEIKSKIERERNKIDEIIEKAIK